MSDQLTAHRPPDFKSDGVAVWVNKDRKKRKYLSIQIVGLKTVVAFHVDYYAKKEPAEPTETKKAEFISAQELLEEE